MISSALAAVLVTGFQSQSIDAYCQSGLRDLRFDGKLVKGNVKEAGKIDSDWRRNLAFPNLKVYAKEPFKLRIEASTDDTTGVIVVNGMMQSMRVPKLRVNQKTDLTDQPGRRQTFFEFGMLTPTVAKQYFQSKFVRFDRETGNPVFDLTWPAKYDNTTRHRVWIDKEEKYIVKREWYAQEGRLKATILYSKPVKEGGVAFPTMQQTFNAENKLAGEFHYTNVKINDGVDDSLFSI